MWILMTLGNRHITSKPLCWGLLSAINFGWTNLAQRWQAWHSVIWTNRQKRQVALSIHILCLPPPRQLTSAFLFKILHFQLALQLFLFLHDSRQRAPVALFTVISSILNQLNWRNLHSLPPWGIAIKRYLCIHRVFHLLFFKFAEFGGFGNKSTFNSGQSVLKLSMCLVIVIH